MSDMPFVPVLLGADINVYSMARAFHEAYGIKTIAFGRYPSGPCYGSDIIDYRISENNSQAGMVLKNVSAVASEFPHKRVIVLGCGDDYLTAIAANIGRYPENVIAPYISLELMTTLIHKARFYELCDKYGIDHPATFVHRRELGHDFTLPFAGPFALKPAESYTYWDHPFPGQKKAYILHTREEVDKALDEIYASGYADEIIIQDYIPGDDSFMRVVTNYSDQDGKVRLMCLGHVLLEEHSRLGIGNHSVIITEHEPELCEKLRLFLEDIGYTGFSNFDVKFDQRDGKFKVFEINCRQGRSNYYVTGAGYNLAKFLVEDLIYRKPQELIVTKNQHLWQVVPMKVITEHVNPRYLPQVKALRKAGAWVNPLLYKEDKNLMHRLHILWGQLRFIKGFRLTMPKNQ